VRTLFGGDYVAAPFDAWIVEMDPQTLEPLHVRELTELRGRVGTGGEDHIFAWKDAETLYVPLREESAVYEVNARTGRIGRKVIEISGEMTVAPGGEYVLCAQGNGAGYGRIDYDEGGEAYIGDFTKLGGCQTNISFDNDHLLWIPRKGQMAMMDLETKEHRNLNGIKEALPSSHNYIYFPALVRDMSFLVFGGGDEHSHGYADYEIFLVPWDREANERTGPPVRYTFNDRGDYPGADRKDGHAMDRWPHAWVYNPRFSRDTRPRGSKRARPLENLESDLLAGEIKRFRKGASLQPMYRVLERYKTDPDNPEKALEADRILKHLNGWAEQTLASARKAETDNAVRALDLYTMVRKRYQGLPPGKTARKRVTELRQDEAFTGEVKAWSKLEQLREVAANFRVPDGASASCEDPAFASKNASEIKRFMQIMSQMQKDHPNTRGMLEARSLAQRYEVPVPAVKTSGEVKATVIATVTRTSRPLKADDVAPYTEALICTEYEIKEVVSGKCEKNRILTAQLAMSEGKQLPPASFEVGETYRLKLGDWQDQPHYHSHPIAQDIFNFEDPEAKLHFVLKATPVDER
jgi:hypothetical protein